MSEVSADEFDRTGAAYLARLTDADLRTLVRADAHSAADSAAAMRALRSQPALVLDVLDRPATSAAILNRAADPNGATFTFISPFLVFAAAIHRTAADLASSSYAPERAAARLRVPVFDNPQLTAYLAQPRHRLFLADVLVSFARISSGVTVTRTARGLRRRRWSDLDPTSLAARLEAAPDIQRPAIWRRLGDLALFLAGVFPDAADRLLAGPFDQARLARRTGVGAPAPDLAAVAALEWFGPRWYQLAASRGPSVTGDPLPASTDDFHLARRVLNTATDRYLFPAATSWLASG